MDKQTIFDTVWNGLASQGFYKSSPDQNKVGACYYRYEGKKCAAGWIIPDSEYNPAMDDIDNGDTNVWNVDWFKNQFDEESLTFISQLQSAHDIAKSPKNMRDGLRCVAELHDLKVPN